MHSPTSVGSFAHEPRVYIKILVSHAAAGGIIGKVSLLDVITRFSFESICHSILSPPLSDGTPIPLPSFPQGGHHVSAIQAKTSAKIQLSKSSESLPTTKERIILITGTVKQVVAALDVIINKIIQEQQLLDQLQQYQPSKQDSIGVFSPPNPVPSSGSGGVGGGKGGGELSSGSSGATSVCSLPLSDTTTITTTAASTGNGSEIEFKLKLLVPNSLIEVMQGKNGQHIKAAQKTHNVTVIVHHNPSQLSPLHHKLTVITGEPSNVIKAATCLTLPQTDHSQYSNYCDLPIPPSLSALPENDDMNLQRYYYHQEQLNYYNYYYNQQQLAAEAAAAGYSAAGEYFSAGGYVVDEAIAWAMQQQQQYAYYYCINDSTMYSPHAPVMATPIYSSPPMGPSSSAPVMAMPQPPNSSPHTSPSSSSKQRYPPVEAEVLLTMTERQSIAVLGKGQSKLEDLERAANVCIVVMGLTSADSDKTKKKGTEGYKLRQLQIRGGHANVQYAQQLIGQRLMESGAEVQEIERRKMQGQQRYRKKSGRGRGGERQVGGGGVGGAALGCRLLKE
jgi:hypothetical protein